jgi:imidazolonepropionase-like amidohydrolase
LTAAGLWDRRFTRPDLISTGGSTPQGVRETVEHWASKGATSFKAYMHISRSELAAAIDAAHRRGLKVTGHLCSIGFREAIDLGIDNLEHGLVVDAEFVPGKEPNSCPIDSQIEETLSQLDVNSPSVQELIRDLVGHHVAVTSTLPVFETFVPDRGTLDPRKLSALDPEARSNYLNARERISENRHSLWPILLKKEMQFELEFVEAGGLLLAGEDPTGYGGDLAGFGDQREVELLVEAGFTPLAAIHIATQNGADFLGESKHIGAIARGKQADLVVIRGNPSSRMADIENVEIVFKDGIGYESAGLIQSVQGYVGSR